MISDHASCGQHVQRNGKIVLNDEPCFVDCVIREISEDGAFVDMKVAVALPQKVYLWEELNGVVLECELQRQKDFAAELSFTDLCERKKRRALLRKGYSFLTNRPSETRFGKEMARRVA